jgi:hypothetical protein
MSPQPVVLRKFVCLSLLFFFGALAARPQVQPRVVRAVDNTKKVTLAGNVHPLAKAEFDQGAVADAQPMNRILLLLKRSDAQEAALADALEKQQDRSSPNYHKWLTPEQFGTLYGPADADIQTVTQWLISQGFAVTKVYSGKTVIEFSGTAAQVRAAFGTDIRNYQVAGKSYVANAGDPQIPAALVPVVAGVVSLNNFPRQSHIRSVGVAQKVAGAKGLVPLFTYGSFYGLGPGDFATIYNSQGLVAGGNNGTGETIAIVGETNLNVQDVTDFRTIFGLPATFNASNVILNGEDPGITSTGEETEADLDVQWSGAVAPGATVNFVVSASTATTSGVDLSALYIIEHNMADVMSESYGSCEANLGSGGNAFFTALWQQAAAQGITAILSSGDGGSAGCDNFDTEQVATKGLAVSGMASTPYNVSVGGTDFDQVNQWSTYWSYSNAPVTQTSALKYIPEIPWNQNCAQIGLTGCGASAPNGSLNIVAGSGGPSSSHSKPNWQMGVTPNDSHRDQPDVSLFASPGFNGTGYLVCQQDTYSRCNAAGAPDTPFIHIVGGTSASAPAFAGVMALVNQYQAAHGGTGRQGNANYILYALANKAGNSCASNATETAGCVFNDVTKGSSALPAVGGAGVGTNSVPCKGGTLNCSSTVSTVNGVLVDPSHATTEAWTAGTGYDMTTGLGSVNIANLATSWGTVSTVSTTTTLTLTPSTGITHGTGENVNVAIGVAPKSGTATGNVSLIAKFADGTTQGLDQFTLGANGNFSGKTTSLPGGNYQVYAHYAGDGVNAPSDSTLVTVSVGQEGSKTFIVVPLYDIQTGNLISGNASSVPYGSPYRIRMYVTNSSATANPTGPPTPTCDQVNELTCPTGTVTLTANGTGVDRVNGVYSLDNIGYTRDINPTLGGGSYALAAQYSGDNSYSAGQPATDSLTVTPTATVTTIDTNDNSGIGTVGVAFNLNMVTRANSFGIPPTGTYTVYDGGTAVTGTSTIWNGQSGTTDGIAFSQASVTFNFSTAGTHILTAKYSGDANYASSTTATSFSVIVKNGTTTTMTANPTNIIAGNTMTLTAIVDTAVKSPTPSGTVVFYGGGDGYFSGNVTYKNITDSNGNAALQATLVVTPLYSEDIWAIFGGDNNFAPSDSMSTPVSITVVTPDYSVSPTQIALTIPAGQSASAPLTVTPATNLTSQVTFTIGGNGGYIEGMTCAVAPNPVSLSGQQPTSTSFSCSVPAPSSSATATSQLFIGWPEGMQYRNWWGAGAVALVTGLFLLLLPSSLKMRRVSYACFGIGLVSLAIGCGGGSTGGGGGPTQTATTIKLTVPGAKVASNVYGTATVTVTGTQSPTGTVTIFDNTSNQSIGSASLVNGQAQMQIGFAGVGSHSLIAQYAGDANNKASQTQSPIVVVVTGTLTGTVWLSADTGADHKAIPLTLTVQ